jgi:hypothetical protein
VSTLRFTPDPAAIVDPALKEWAEPDLRDVIDTINQLGGYRAAGRMLGRDHAGLVRRIERLQKRAALAGYSPRHGMTETVPDPFVLKARSVLRKTDPITGQKRELLAWDKSSLDDERKVELIKEGIRGFMEGFGPVSIEPFSCPDPCSDVIPWIQIGDAHIGMLAHEAEAGANFNIEIAEREICAAFRLIIEALEPCERLVINDLGDSTHFENTEKKTAASRHDLDGERPRQMIRAISRIMRFVVDLALTKARIVDVIVNQGNHSRFGDFWMHEMLEVAFAHTGRVNVLDNENVFIGYRMGNTLVMVHHSDKCSVDKLPGVMMEDFKQDFAETEFHYVDIGHIHHKMTAKEKDGVVVESWNTLARGDKWHREKGYRARQSMSVVFRSRAYGEVGRRTVPIQMIYDAIKRGHANDGVVYLPTQRRAFAA